MDRSTFAQYASAMSEWTKPYSSPRCEVCGRALATPGADWTGQMNQWYTAYQPMMDNLTRMWSTMAQPWLAPTAYQGWPGAQTQRPGRHPHHEGHRDKCDCGDRDGCRDDRCHCRCCITDADMVVYARLGETRVVPLTFENPRRRERQVKLELSNWTSRGGTAGAIKARFLGPTEFTLAPCEEREAVLVIEATPANQSGGQEVPTRIVIPDVDDCQVFYADLRVEGCEMRPLRIALALLPRDCAALKVECGCDCC